MQILNI